MPIKTDAIKDESSQNVKRHVKISDKPPTLAEKLAVVLSWAFVIIFFPFSIFCLLKVNEFERAVIFRLGRLRKRARGPGLVWYFPCIDDVFLVDLRTRVVDIPRQEMITLDSVTISVDGVLFYYIANAKHVQIQIKEVHESTIFTAQATLRNMVGSMTLGDLLESRTKLSSQIAVDLEQASKMWGIKIVRVEIKDIILPESLQKTLAIEAEAIRGARAKIISAQGELDASSALKEASDMMAKNPVTLQLRHLQNLIAISQKRELEIYFPFPMNVMGGFQTGTSESNKGTNGSDGGNTDPSASGYRRLSDFSSNVIQRVVGRLSSVSTYLQGLAEDYGNDTMPDPFGLDGNPESRTRSADYTHVKRRDIKKSSRATQTDVI